MHKPGSVFRYLALALAVSAGRAGANPIQHLDLSASVTANEGLVKHLYSFALPAGGLQWVGLTGSVSLATTENYFGEALVTVTYYAGPNCAAINGTSYPSYDSPGFPQLTHLAAFILKSPRARTVTQRAAIHLTQGVRLAPCIVVILDGGGAWGPGHGNGYTVTMSSALSLDYARISTGQDPVAVPYDIGGEWNFGPGALATGSAVTSVMRVNPQTSAYWAVDTLFGSISGSAFDGSSGEVVPTGPWTALVQAWSYPSAACAAAFTVDGPFNGPLHVFTVETASRVLPQGGELVRGSSFSANGESDVQTSYAGPTWPLTLAPGDCLAIRHEATANGVIDLEDQSTAMLRPLGR